MIELKHGVWIVVADSDKALFMRNITDHQDPNFEVIREERPQMDADDLKPSDEAGRRNDNGPHQKSAVQEPYWHQLARDRVTADLADLLYARAHRGAFRHLVLVAAPKILGALRKELHQEVAERVIAEIPKEMTNLPVYKMETMIKSALDAM